MFSIKKITVENYSKFDDMIYWRINGEQRIHRENNASDEIKNELSNPNLSIYVAEANDIFVGWISLIYMPKVGRFNGKGHIYVDELWVEPSYRNKGIAKSLMYKADELVARYNATGIRLYVNSNNPSAKNLYQKCGFESDGQAEYMEKSNFIK